MDTKTALSEATVEAAQLKDPVTNTISSNKDHSLMKIPPEIRLLIYKELLVRNGAAELSFCPGEHHKSYNHALKFFVHPAILRTCKTIYHEAFPILYTDNIFELLCVFGQLGKQHLWYRTLGPSPLFTCPNPHASTYLKRVFLTYIGIGLKRSDIAQFPTCWPKIEREILELYPNVESIFVQICLANYQAICIKLVRRRQSKHSETPQGQDYTILLKNFAILRKRSEEVSHPGEDVWRILKALCNAIARNEMRGCVGDTAFAVQAIRWASGSRGFHLSWEDFDVCEMYFGFEVKSKGEMVVRDESSRGE